MTPLNEVPVGKFCRFEQSIIYLYKNNFNDCYGVIPIVGRIATDKKFDFKVYIYKRVKKEWLKKATEWLNEIYNTSNGQTISNGIVLQDEIRVDNLTYIENLNILKNYNKPDIVVDGRE